MKQLFSYQSERIGRYKYIATDRVDAEFEDIMKNLVLDLNHLLKKEEA